VTQRHLNNTSSLRSVNGSFGEAQIVAVPNRVVLDIAARNFDTLGFSHTSSALASMDVDAAIQLRDALSAAINAAANLPPAHPGIWSTATNRVARRVTRRAAQ
jgi:hypothetical protein